MHLACLALLAIAMGACGAVPASQRNSSSTPQQSRTSSASGADDTTYGSGATTEVDDSADGEVEVPDATLGDGADAWSAAEDAGLTPTFADANNDPSFDTGRDGTGCDVIDQNPAAGDMAAEGDEVEITIDCGQVDWENQEGPAWDDFNDAYSSAFDDGCQALFDESPDGSLYEDDTEYSVLDCQNLNPGDASQGSDVPSDVPDDPEGAGTEHGELDGCQSLFEQEGVASLNWGEDSITEYDCPVGGIAVVAPHPKRHHDRTTAPSAPCTGSQADGSTIAVRTDNGKVNCAGAVALWNEFLKRAPSEGVGSSGLLELDGWGCAGASGADKSHLGSCGRTDNTAAFTVVAAG